MAVPPWPRWIGRVSRLSGSLTGLLRHAERVELIAVRIAEIGGVEPAATHTWRTFVAAAVGEREGVKAVDLRLVLRFEGDHHAIADGGQIAVVRLYGANARAAARRAQGNVAVVFHHPRGAEFFGDGVIEARRARQVVGADGNVPDHAALPRLRLATSGTLEEQRVPYKCSQASSSHASAVPSSCGASTSRTR